MHRFVRLMVCLRGSETDPELIRYAAMIARLGTVREAHFLHDVPPRDGDPDPSGAECQAMVAREFTDIPEGVTSSQEVLRGPLLDVVLTEASEREIDLILVGHRKNRPRRRSIARRLAMKAPCSVWMAPEGSSLTLNRILVPVDFSERSADALVVAAGLAARAGCRELLALHVRFEESRLTFEGDEEAIKQREQQEFDAFLAPLDLHGVAVRSLFVDDPSPAHAIARLGMEQKADLIVMATRGRTRSSAILLGSVAEDTLIESDLPVLIVKHFGDHLGVLKALLERVQSEPGDPHFQ